MSFFERILNKSNSYLYYKNNYFNLIKENENLKDENKKLKSSLNEKSEEIDSFNNEFKKLSKDNEGIKNSVNSNKSLINSLKNDLKNERLRNLENNYAFVFHDTIKESKWLKSKNFSLINAASNYSFIYILYRILDEMKPVNILEMGLGQTTKLTTQYADYFKFSNLTTIEGDQVWIDNFSKNIEVPDNANIVQCDVERVVIDESLEIPNKTIESNRYKNLDKILKDEKFDLIIIDGPQGFIDYPPIKSSTYSRTNIWNLIPNNLADEFIIIIDDYDRIGEQNTIKHVEELLNKENIKFDKCITKGLKTQCIILTEKYKFVKWF